MHSGRRPFRASIIGAGKVGTTLAVMLRRRGFDVLSVVSAHRNSARRCARLVECRCFSTRTDSIAADTELLVIAVSDEKIRTVARKVSAHPRLRFRQLGVFHTSGSLTSDELEPLRRKGALAFSLHPIQTFPKGLPLDLQLKSMRGITYGIEGPSQGIAYGKKIVRKLEGHILVVPKKEKILYHLACVLASNYPVALLSAVDELVAAFAGPPRLRHFHPLIETSIRNALQHSPQRALTGPVSRGSKRIVEAHMRVLRDRPLLREIYRGLGMYAVTLAGRAGRLTKRQQREMKRSLSDTE